MSFCFNKSEFLKAFVHQEEIEKLIMATSMRSYGLIDADSRCLYMISAQPGEHLHLDQLIGVNLSPIQALKIEEGDEDLWCLLIDQEPAYSTSGWK
uniref:Uncharacterized protein n=1 Tax=Lactuca sativa TaxID=4236 RepID=A0A9R1W5W7_LACSA|nr:hypothetical protein LSAT_V11C300129160 [Lactuca sativa]